jgi:cAMP-dependent protein kinase regulator
LHRYAAGSEKAKVWALDRTTFKKILSEAAFKRRKANEELLNKVKLLEELDDYRYGCAS